jgi:hypothetical protein
MTREEAERLCAQYAETHPDRAVAQWRPQEQPDGTWTVARIGLPPTPDTTTEQRADERPPTPPDPRPDVPPTTGLPV